MSGLLSVIVPIYNTEKYLRECVESILGQTYKEIELILVDDGSTDMSGMICDKYEEMDSRVRVIHEKHGGPLMARCIGAERASGNYVTFVDSDDWIVDNAYELLMVPSDNIDIVISGIRRYYNDNKVLDEKPITEPGIYDKTEIEQYIIPYMLWSKRKNHCELDPSLCTKIMKKQLAVKYLNKAVSLGIHYGDDAAVIYPMMLEVQSVLIMHESFYFHRQRKAEEASPYIKNDVDFFIKLYRLYKFLRTEFENSRFCDTLLNQLDHFYISAVKLKEQYYGDYYEINRDLFPFWKITRNKKIVLYGAGDLGKEYFKQNMLYDFCQIIMWVDKNYNHLQCEGGNISSPESIKTVEFDYLLIAVKSIELAREIQNDLISKGISKEKIIWSGTKTIEFY